MGSNNYSWWEFLKMIFAFFMGRRKQEQQQKQDNFNKTTTDLNQKYNEVDKNKEDKKADDLKDRLNNMF